MRNFVAMSQGTSRALYQSEGGMEEGDGREVPEEADSMLRFEAENNKIL